MDLITKRMNVNSKDNNAKDKPFSTPKFRDQGKWGKMEKKTQQLSWSSLRGKIKTGWMSLDS